MATPESTSGRQAEVSRKQALVRLFYCSPKKHYSQKRTSDEEGDDPEANTDEEEEGQGQTRAAGKQTSAFQRNNRDLAKSF